MAGGGSINVDAGCKFVDLSSDLAVLGRNSPTICMRMVGTNVNVGALHDFGLLETTREMLLDKSQW